MHGRAMHVAATVTLKVTSEATLAKSLSMVMFNMAARSHVQHVQVGSQIPCTRATVTHDAASCAMCIPLTHDCTDGRGGHCSSSPLHCRLAGATASVGCIS
jgi:hypothetical protein